MSVQLPPNSTGSVVDTLTTVTNSKERQVVLTNCAPPGGTGTNFSITHTPVAATQATITQAAAGAGIRNVAASIFAVENIGGTLQTLIQLNLRDGATGAGTILWSASLGGATTFTTGTYVFNVSGICVVGTANTAMTLEFSAAGVAASTQSVCLTGYTTA
jgi:cysteine sulfinate desulfinase/cysteine desulfurase-like protein